MQQSDAHLQSFEYFLPCGQNHAYAPWVTCDKDITHYCFFFCFFKQSIFQLVLSSTSDRVNCWSRMRQLHCFNNKVSITLLRDCWNNGVLQDEDCVSFTAQIKWELWRGAFTEGRLSWVSRTTSTSVDGDKSLVLLRLIFKKVECNFLLTVFNAAWVLSLCCMVTSLVRLLGRAQSVVIFHALHCGWAGWAAG